MSLCGDYLSEMRELRGLSDRDIERLLSGEALGRSDLDEVATLLRNLRAMSARAPGDEVANRQVAATVAAARVRAHGAAPAGAAPPAPLMRRVRVAAARAAAAVVTLTGATAGLAYAGVDLPGQATERAFEAVLNVELPNQARPEEPGSGGAGSGGPSAVAERVRAVIEAWGEAARGCEFGQSVASAARGENGAGPEKDPCEGAEGNAQGGKATGEEKSAAGKARSDEAREDAAEKAAAGKATGEEQSAEGRATAEEKSSAGTGEQKSSEGKSTGEEKSGGRDNAPEGSGKP